MTRPAAKMFSVLLLLIVSALPVMSLADEPASDAVAEINYLLETVAASDCTFIRNGKKHAAADAAEHLQMKRRRGKRYFSTTEEFIERLASKSSWTGKPYLIQCQNEPEQPAGEWFTRYLQDYRSSRN